jgi:hypothetical protein
MGDRGRGFADIAYTILVVEKTPSVERAAALLGMEYATLHSRLIGRTCFSADEIRDLICAVPDARLVSCLLEGSRFVAAERLPADEKPRDAQAASRSIQSGAARVVVSAADVLEIVDASIAGGNIDHRAEVLVLKEIDETERALASLRLRIEDCGSD